MSGMPHGVTRQRYEGESGERPENKTERTDANPKNWAFTAKMVHVGDLKPSCGIKMAPLSFEWIICEQVASR